MGWKVNDREKMKKVFGFVSEGCLFYERCADGLWDVMMLMDSWFRLPDLLFVCFLWFLFSLVFFTAC